MTKKFYVRIIIIASTNTAFFAANTILIEYEIVSLIFWYAEYTAEISENALPMFNTPVRERNVTIYATNIRCDIRAVDFSCSFSPFSRRAICVLYRRCFVPGEKADGTLYSGRFASSHLFLSLSSSSSLLLSLSLSTSHKISYNLCTPRVRS